MNNSEFKKLYPRISDEVEYYTKKAEEVFVKYEIDGRFTHKGTKANVQKWIRHKRGLIRILRNHPDWNEEAKAIVFKSDIIRVPNEDRIGSLYMDLICFIWDNINVHPKMAFMSDIGFESLTMTQDEVDTIRRYLPHIKARAGQKKNRVINAIFREMVKYDCEIFDATTLEEDHLYGERNFKSYNKLYAAFSDAMTPMTIKRITMLSVNFIDYLLMSNGNSWASCQYINSKGLFKPESSNHYNGCSKAGVLSYANDATSMVLYSLPENYHGNKWCDEFKLTRQMFHYDNNLLLQSRLYPDRTDTGAIDEYRRLVQMIIAECLHVPNLWSIKKLEVCGNLNKYIRTDEESLHYSDYGYEENNIILSLHKEYDGGLVRIGEKGLCVDCGETLTDGRHLQCECRDRVSCHKCGKIVPASETYFIDGERYCDDCGFYCEVHDMYECGDMVRWEGSTRISCRDGYDSRACKCDVCGQDHFKSNARVLADGRTCCPSCFSTLTAFCKHCGSLIYTSGKSNVFDEVCICCEREILDTLKLIESGEISDLDLKFNYELAEQSSGEISLVIRKMPTSLNGRDPIVKINRKIFSSINSVQYTRRAFFLWGNCDWGSVRNYRFNLYDESREELRVNFALLQAYIQWSCR